MAISPPEELLMEDVSALDTAGAANAAETVSNNILHGCDSEVVTTTIRFYFFP
jgi:hypothetical protein